MKGGVGVGCVGMGGECGWRRGEEGGRKGRGREEERATDSIEPQNSHKQSALWLGSSLSQNWKKF